MELPPWFDSSRLELATETHEGMLSIDQKNYVLFDGKKLTKHGSGLKGRHLPVICDRFVADLCWAIFEGRKPIEVYRKYRDLTKFPEMDFYFNLNLGKTHYKAGTLYAKIAHKADVNRSLFILKTEEGYDLEGAPDCGYYLKRLSKMAERITGRKAKFVLKFLKGQESLM